MNVNGNKTNVEVSTIETYLNMNYKHLVDTILENIGSNVSLHDVIYMFNGKTYEEILEVLNGWWSIEDSANDVLAKNIYDLLSHV